MWFPRAESTLAEDPRVHRILCQQWHKVSDPNSAAHRIHGAHAEVVTSPSRLRRYVAKYASRDDNGESITGARQWGYTRSLPRGPIVHVTVTHLDALFAVRFVRRLMRSRSHRRRWIRGYTRYCAVVVAYCDWRTAATIVDTCAHIDLLGERPPPDGLPL